MKSWDDLRLVGAVAEQGSMAAAARFLGLDHSTVFRRLNALEQELGVRLFDRTRQACTPTPAGERIITTAGEILRKVESIKQIAQEFSNEKKGTLSIATTHTQARYALPPVIRDFIKQYR